MLGFVVVVLSAVAVAARSRFARPTVEARLVKVRIEQPSPPVHSVRASEIDRWTK